MNFWSDVRYGLRMLRKSPGFALTAVITLALGIGATTAMYSCADALLWKPVPLPHLETLVMIGQRMDDPNDFNSVTPADIDDVRRQANSFESLAVWQQSLANITGQSGQPDRVYRALVSANFFDVIGVRPARGRGFEAREDQPGRESEVILSDGLWRNRFAGDPNIIGQTIRLDDQSYAVVGVMPPKYAFPLGMDLWTPLALTPAQRTSRTNQMIQTMARLKPGRTVEQASAELEGISAQLRTAYPNTNKGRHFTVWTSHRYLVDRETNDYIVMLLGAVCFVLLIACANVANLQFARATGRMREVAVRTALGAGRGRIVTQLVTESVILSLTGAALGLLIANWCVHLTRAGMPPEIQKYIVGWEEMSVDGRALLFTLTAAVVTGILAGLAPAWQNSRPNLTDCLKEGGRGGSAGSGHHRLRRFLVGGEVTLAVVLLVGAGLMIRGFHNILAAGEQVEPGTLLTMRLSLTDTKYHEPYKMAAFYRDVVARLGALPSVKSAAAVTSMPYSNHSNSRAFTIEGITADPQNLPSAMFQVTSPGYFTTVHVALRAGRYLTDGDGPDAPRVVVISQQLADRWWPKESPVGRKIRLGNATSTQPWMTIVGVVANAPHNPYDRAPRREMYVPYQQAPSLGMDIGVRTAGNPLLVAPAVLEAIRSIDPEQPVTDMQTMEKAIHDRSIGLNYVQVFMGVFGVLALVLAAIGVYGVMAFLVSEQTRDIGVRVALGASRGSVLGMVFSKGMLTAVIGLVIGLPIAYWLAKQLEHLIFGVQANDVTTFVGIPLTLLAATALAIYLPARRAMKIDPIVALRYE